MGRRARRPEVIADAGALEATVADAGIVRDLRPVPIGTVDVARMLGVTPARVCRWSTVYGHPRSVGARLERRRFDRREIQRIAAALAAGASIEQASAWEDERSS